MSDAEAATAPPHHTPEINVIELSYRPGGTISLPDGRTASTEFAAARTLLADGHDPATPVRTRWPGSPHVSLSGTLGGWAKLTVTEEPRMGLARHRPRQAADEPATRRFGEGELPTTSGATQKAAGDASRGPRKCQIPKTVDR